MTIGDIDLHDIDIDIDIDIVEVDEAFAPVVPAWLGETGGQVNA